MLFNSKLVPDIKQRYRQSRYSLFSLISSQPALQKLGNQQMLNNSMKMEIKTLKLINVYWKSFRWVNAYWISLFYHFRYMCVFEYMNIHIIACINIVSNIHKCGFTYLCIHLLYSSKGLRSNGVPVEQVHLVSLVLDFCYNQHLRLTPEILTCWCHYPYVVHSHPEQQLISLMKRYWKWQCGTPRAKAVKMTLTLLSCYFVLPLLGKVRNTVLRTL